MTIENPSLLPDSGCLATYVEHENPDGTTYCAATCPLIMAGLCPTFTMPHETWDMDANDPALSPRRQELQNEVSEALQVCPGPLPKP